MIDLQEFKSLAMPVQSFGEWLGMFQFLKSYFETKDIYKPVVVEVGIQSNLQKAFWKKFLNADHIGIDMAVQYSTPDIVGDANSEGVLSRLKMRLAGRPINLTFIDADLHYDAVKAHFDTYEPLTQNIIVLHTIFCTDAHPDGARRLWRELFGYQKQKYDFVMFYSYFPPDHPCHRYQMGTGLLIKK